MKSNCFVSLLIEVICIKLTKIAKPYQNRVICLEEEVTNCMLLTYSVTSHSYHHYMLPFLKLDGDFDGDGKQCRTQALVRKPWTWITSTGPLTWFDKVPVQRTRITVQEVLCILVFNG